MYKMCHMNREVYKSNTEIYDKNQKKMMEALNKAELVRLIVERHFKETKHDSDFLCGCKGLIAPCPTGF